MKTIQEVYVLKNGVKMPKVGFGTWQIPEGDVCYNSVSQALKHGYRHIDTAAAYRNEKSVGKAIKDSGIPRDQVFVYIEITILISKHIKKRSMPLSKP